MGPVSGTASPTPLGEELNLTSPFDCINAARGSANLIELVEGGDCARRMADPELRNGVGLTHRAANQDAQRGTGSLRSDNFNSGFGEAEREELQSPDDDVSCRLNDVLGTAAKDHTLPKRGSSAQTSATNYLQQISDLVESGPNPEKAPKEVRSHSTWLRQPLSRQSTIIDHDCVLPNRTTADALMRIFWTNIYPLYPFIHRPSFQKDYDALWKGNPVPGARMFHCILNAVFALSCQIDRNLPSETRESASTTYFGRAEKLLQLDFLDPGNFETVQALLLLAQYLQGTNSPSRSWRVVGLAIRTAQSLGLHKESVRTAAMTQKEREMFRRVWHGCVLLDR